MEDISYYHMIQNSYNRSLAEAIIGGYQDDIVKEMNQSLGLVQGKINGIDNQFVISATDRYYKYNIMVYPNQTLCPGDLIECKNLNWIVMETKPASNIQVVGMMWLCNFKLRFQNNSPNIIERWAIFDNVSLSDPQENNLSFKYPDTHHKIYLSLDDETKLIYEDKRIASGIKYNSSGQQILDVYDITGVKNGRQYGNGSHLLTLDCRSGKYNNGKDNLEEMICDYIESDTTPSPTSDVKIFGDNKIRLGISQTYIAKFYDANGEELNSETPIWTVTEQNIICSTKDDGSVIIVVPDEDSLIGSTVHLSVHSSSHALDTTIPLEVIPIV